jgi:7,8-dihydroneopterin aldolase/epimerase/oxygenase
MTDIQTISLSDVSATLHLGVSAEERARAQTVMVTVSVTLLDPPAFTGEPHIVDTVDYDHIIHYIRDALPSEGEIILIETIADRVAAHCISLSPRITEAEVTVKKPSVLTAPSMVSVTIRRTVDPAQRRQALHVAE